MTDQEEWDSLLHEMRDWTNFTAWEVSFIDDMLIKSEACIPFTPKQGLMIETIYKRRE